MTQALHSRARTTHLIREEIRNSTLPQRELAERYNVSRLTIRKWQNRDSAEDRSHRPHTMHTTLTPAQELVVIALRGWQGQVRHSDTSPTIAALNNNNDL